MKLLIWGVIIFLILAIGFATFILFLGGDEEIINISNNSETVQNTDSDIESENNTENDYSAVINYLKDEINVSEAAELINTYFKFENRADFKTIFIPTNTYLEREDIAISSLNKNKQDLQNFIEDYMFEERLDLATILNLQSSQAQSVSGKQVNIRITNGALLFNGNLTTPEVFESNNLIIHLIQ
ncbi:MAG: hypothetical protein Kow0081_4520 [Candidatus Dojkabacteria bacterium]